MICDVSVTASWIFDKSECNNFGVSTATSGKKTKNFDEHFNWCKTFVM